MISLAELQRRIDAGDLSADAAIAQSLEAIRAHEKPIGAFVCRNENARAQGVGPLRGIAVGIKDIMDTADFPTEMGSPIYRGFRPRGDGFQRLGNCCVGGKFAGRDAALEIGKRDHGWRFLQ